MLKRRDFLKYTVPAASVPIAFNGFKLNAFSNSQLLKMLAQQATDKVLVVIQLSGGNDGLNMVIPVDQYSALSKVRANLLIEEKKVLPLVTTKATGFHPAMTGLQKVYDDAKVRIVQGVGYPNFNFSHFSATDIYMQAPVPDTSVVGTGWLGRYLDIEFPGFPDGYPNAQFPDPPAIQFGSAVAMGLLGMNGVDGVAINDPNGFYQVYGGFTADDAPPLTAYGRELKYLRLMILQTQKYTDAIHTAAASGKNLSPYYVPGSSLGAQLQAVARLISGGLTTKIYMVQQGGYDTHSNQVQTGATDTGSHANLLQELSDAIYAFQDDLRRLNLEDRVVGMTFSEFGRRIKSNGSFGSDHGTSYPMVVFGSQVIPGFLGTNPAIPTDASVVDNLPLQTDFRQVYNSLLKDWMGLSDAQLATVLFQNWNYVEIIKKPGVTYPFAIPDILSQNYPNPFIDVTTINYYAYPGTTIIDVWDIFGRKLATLVEANLLEGSYSLQFDGRRLAVGVYYCRIQTGGKKKTLGMIKA